MDGRLAINLVNTAGPQADKQLPIFSEIPAGWTVNSNCQDRA